ncbi:hypothetical protein HDV00_004862 [Rhizophlyctis rosea]|nr:hypothetical protein HDV00_004862 [Rhizophlyctis rosea]
MNYNILSNHADIPQYAATHTLHHLCSHTSLHLLLPPDHRTYWATLTTRKSSLPPQQQTILYAPDPFIAKETHERETKEAVRERERERERREERRERRIEEMYPEVKMSEGNRTMVEDVVKSLGSASGTAFMSSKSESPAALLSTITNLGFRKAHVEEALSTLGSAAGKNAALDWLCIHVPEDDLPPHFAPTRKDVTVNVHTTETLKRRYAVDRILGMGFSKGVVEQALDECEGDEVKAVGAILRDLCGVTEDAVVADGVEMGEEERIQIREEEVESLKAIFGVERVEYVTSDQAITVTVELNVTLPERSSSRPRPPRNAKSTPNPSEPPRTTLEVTYAPTSLYPLIPPNTILKSSTLPAYIRLAIIKSLNVEARRMCTDGETLGGSIWSLACYAESLVPEIVENPPPLLSISRGVSTIAQEEATRIDAVGTGRPKAAKKRRVMSAAEEAEFNRQCLTKEQGKEILDGWKRMVSGREKLPVWKYREEIVRTVMESKGRVTVLCGETGWWVGFCEFPPLLMICIEAPTLRTHTRSPVFYYSGKSTQTPQFLLSHYIRTKNVANSTIMVTQPRRISAISLAERVASERCEDVGDSVGYIVRGEQRRGDKTRVVFCTTGVLVRMCTDSTEGGLEGVGCVVVDEVHERSVDSDFTLLLLRRLLPRYPSLRIILMSATLDSNLFSSYFSPAAPVLNVPGFTFPITDYYLEDIVKMTAYKPEGRWRKEKGDDEDQRDGGQWGGVEEGVRGWLRGVGKTWKVESGVVREAVRWCCAQSEGAILIFAPGVQEIKDTIRALQPIVSECGLEVMPLHANLSPAEQRKVFGNVGKGRRKCVVSTNVAETSVTIDDVVYVIDTGLVKELRHTQIMQTLSTVPTSLASARQRRGRAGRTRPGVCLKLFTRQMESGMAPRTDPEMRRVGVEHVMLSIMSMTAGGGIEGAGGVRGILGEAIEPPEKDRIEDGMRVLKGVGAVVGGGEDTEVLTGLGRCMARIPADLRIAKILLFGAIFKCLTPILTIASVMSTKSPFVSPMEKREEARTARERFAMDRSDWLTDAKAFDAWVDAMKNGGRRGGMGFCEENFLSSATLQQITDTRRQYRDILLDLGYIPASYKLNTDSNSTGNNIVDMDDNASDMRILKAVLVAGLYPHVARIQLPEKRFEETLGGTVEMKIKAEEIHYFTPSSRVFLHPSSINFTCADYRQDPFLVYFLKVSTSKVFLRDSTSIGVWPVLMFGGDLRVDHEGRWIGIGGIDEGGQDGNATAGELRVRAGGRVAVLVDGLRRLLDKELERKVDDPGLDIAGTAVVTVMVKLISGDGL